jgi:hypothetical protein
MLIEAKYKAFVELADDLHITTLNMHLNSAIFNSNLKKLLLIHYQNLNEVFGCSLYS